MIPGTRIAKGYKRVAQQNVMANTNPSFPQPFATGLGADSEEKREPAGNIDIAVVVSLKVLDPNRPIREADSCTATRGSLFDHVVGTAEQ
jgi:hypothetical protein